MKSQSDHRYIDVYGYPVHSPAWKHFHQSAGVQTAAVGAAFSAAVVGFAYGPELGAGASWGLGAVGGLGLILPGSAMTFGSQMLERSILSLALGTMNNEQGGPRVPSKLYIDTSPSPLARPTASDISWAKKSTRAWPSDFHVDDRHCDWRHGHACKRFARARCSE